MCGLTMDAALEVANGNMTLEEALGDMDMDLESECGGIIDADEGYDCGCRGEIWCGDCIPF